MSNTIYIVGSGPSIRDTNLGLLKGKDVIAVNHAVQLLPEATVLFSGDETWWRKNESLMPGFWHGFLAVAAHQRGQKYKYQDWVTVYDHWGMDGFAITPGILRGSNSGQMAINLAYHLGATRIVLLGFDCTLANGIHWYPEEAYPQGGKPQEKEYTDLTIPIFESARWIMDEMGIEIVNCTPGSALKTFKQARLEDHV